MPFLVPSLADIADRVADTTAAGVEQYSSYKRRAAQDQV
jgi:hypothetical protein